MCNDSCVKVKEDREVYDGYGGIMLVRYEICPDHEEEDVYEIDV